MTDALPETMTCVEITEPGGPEVLKPGTRPIPRPGRGEVLIRVAAAGINRADTLQRKGGYAIPANASDLLGLEVSGQVVALGEDASGVALGTEVCALVNGGGYAEYCVASANHCLPVPRGLDLVQAGSLPEACFTVWTNVFERASLKPGESFLVHGGSSGIGVTAIQMADRLGSRVMTTARTDEKCATCRSLGAQRAVNYTEEDFVEAAQAFTEGRGVDVILDMVGGDYVARNIEALALEGRVVNIAYMKGSRVEVDLMPAMRKRVTLAASTLRPLPDERKAEIADVLKARIWPLVEAGEIKPVVYATFALADAAETHRLMESSQHIGKIMLRT